VTSGRSVIEVEPAPPSTGGNARSSRGGTRKAPWWLWVGALAIVLPLALAIVGLLVRVLDATPAAWSTLFSQRTIVLVWRSFALTAAVTVTGSVIGVAGAWLLARTDLRFKRTWGVAFALPLVIPSYVIAIVLISASGSSGLVADLTGTSIPYLSEPGDAA
jgi:iron(III) transport system permease protein